MAGMAAIASAAYALKAFEKKCDEHYDDFDDDNCGVECIDCDLYDVCCGGEDEKAEKPEVKTEEKLKAEKMPENKVEDKPKNESKKETADALENKNSDDVPEITLSVKNISLEDYMKLKKIVGDFIRTI